MILVPDSFHEKARGQIISFVTGLYVSFDKSLASGVDFFTLDESILDGDDILSDASLSPITLWSLYDYKDYSDRLVALDWERSVEFPYNVQSAIADITVDNYDNFFTPGSGSSIDVDNLPGRPLRLYAGFEGETMIPQFVGTTQDMPDIDENSKTVEYHALDFLTQIANMNLTSIIDMRNARTDQVLEAIMEQFGLSSGQYDFEEGENVIPFVFFNVGQNAGEAMQKLVQAEGGRMFMDETGIIRFTARTVGDPEAPSYDTLVLPRYSLMEVKPSGTAKLINRVVIQSDVREVQEYQTVYKKTAARVNSASTQWVVPANSTMTIAASLEDPCYDIQAPTLGRSTSVSWFTAVNDQFVQVTSGITATGVLSTNNYTMTFTNSNAFSVEIDELYLWGEPAKVVNRIELDAVDTDSFEKYGEHLLSITDNEFFQDFDGAESYARYILFEYAYYNVSLDLSIKGDFSLQLGDIVDVSDPLNGGAYVVDAIKYATSCGRLTTDLKVHRFVTPDYFILDASVLDGDHLLA